MTKEEQKEINKQMYKSMGNNKAHNNQQIISNNKNKQEKDKIEKSKVKVNNNKKVTGMIIINKARR